MNWKELLGGVFATALLILFALWTTDFEIGFQSGYTLAVIIIFAMSCAWRIALNRFVTSERFSWGRFKAYSLGALIASVVAVIIGV